MNSNKRLIISSISGAVLGIFCIVGAVIRSEVELTPMYLIAFWFNRFLMGIIIGLLPENIKMLYVIFRGAILGALISFAFYSATGFVDMVGFLAGIFYGIIIEYIAYRFGPRKNKEDKV